MNKGIIVFIAVFIVILVIFYLETGFKVLNLGGSTTQHTTTILSNGVATTSINSIYICQQFSIYENSFNKTDTYGCLFDTNSLGIWVAAGNASTEHITIVGADNKTYVNESFSYSCTTFYENFTEPRQIYAVTLTTGPGGGTCGPSIFKFNSTTSPPANETYNFVYNGNFSNGQYSGWNISGAGFGIKPLNITHADSLGCYQGSPWSGYNGTYFATTYDCGLRSNPGNLTSSAFVVPLNKPFLNFKIISPELNNFYIEILYNNTPAIVAHFNTYNVTSSANPQSTFRNASIPLYNVGGKVVKIKIVAGALSGQQKWLSVTGFNIASRPLQDQGVYRNLTIYNTT